jgi:dihydrofolate reductase
MYGQAMINCIVAVERNRGIGFEGQMPWPHLKGDMQWFKQMTTNQVVIMGSTTYDSLGKPLLNRINVVISRKRVLGDHTFDDCGSALDYCAVEYPDKDIFIIGGSAVYEQYLHIIDRFYVTEIDENYQCDKFFDLTYVKTCFTKVTERATFNEPVKYTIKEYNL